MDTHYDIPRQYFKEVADSGVGYVPSTSLWALPPNFESYDKALTHHGFYEVHQKGRRIQIMLPPRSTDGTITITHNAPLTITDDQGNTLVADNDVEGSFGLNLIDRPVVDTSTAVNAVGDSTIVRMAQSDN